MKTIWKYTIDPISYLSMPKGSKVLSVHEQNGDICIWALVDSMNDVETRKFCAYGTGHKVSEDNQVFIGTVHLQNFGLVFHVFEVIED